jgi:hypothetical protein
MPFGRTYPKSLAGLSRKKLLVQDNLDQLRTIFIAARVVVVRLPPV